MEVSHEFLRNQVEVVESFLPLMGEPRPDIPPAPYATLSVPHKYHIPVRQTDSMKVRRRLNLGSNVS